MIAGFHIGRGWEGHEIEDACPCPQEPCGLVDLGRAVAECDQHNPLKGGNTRIAGPPRVADASTTGANGDVPRLELRLRLGL